MARVTITVSEDDLEQLRLRAAAAGVTVEQLIESSLASQKTQSAQRGLELLQKAWDYSARLGPGLSDEELLADAEEIVHEVREQVLRERGEN